MNSPPRVTTEFGLSLLGTSAGVTQQAYRCQLMREPSYVSEQIVANVHPDGTCILGSDQFIASLHIQQLAQRTQSSLGAIVLEVSQPRH